VNGRTDIAASRTGLYALIGSVTMAFMALSSAMVVRRSLGPDWSGVPLPPIVWINTALLALSSLALETRRAGLTALLGLLFLAGQCYAWTGIAIAAAPGNSFFWVFTVLHAAHILGAIAALRFARPELARLFWHFLAGLWIYLLVLFALWGNR
jgi:cytochrome c oxidase subunit 3